MQVCGIEDSFQGMGDQAGGKRVLSCHQGGSNSMSMPVLVVIVISPDLSIYFAGCAMYKAVGP